MPNDRDQARKADEKFLLSLNPSPPAGGGFTCLEQRADWIRNNPFLPKTFVGFSLVRDGLKIARRGSAGSAGILSRARLEADESLVSAVPDGTAASSERRLPARPRRAIFSHALRHSD